MDMTNILPILRVRIGLPADDTSKDDQLTAAWNGSLALAETYCDRKFDFKADAQETFTYESDKTISLERYPLKSITQIMLADGSLEEGPFRFNRKAGVLFAYGYACDEELTITYEGGYETLPEDLMQALLYTFDAVWKSNAAGGGGIAAPGGDIKAISVPDVGRVEFDTAGSSGGTGSVDAWGLIPATATSILWWYRREFA